MSSEFHDVLLRGVGDVGNFTGEATFVQDKDAVAHAEDLGQFGTDHQHGLAVIGKLMDELVDFKLCAHVDAACGFVKNHHVGIALEPLGKHDLLLVAP